eukprot:scaffold1601_cov59-Cylindrotheca_fusiformis.AAC.4
MGRIQCTRCVSSGGGRTFNNHPCTYRALLIPMLDHACHDDALQTAHAMNPKSENGENLAEKVASANLQGKEHG